MTAIPSSTHEQRLPNRHAARAAEEIRAAAG
jgi:hypothetical protein